MLGINMNDVITTIGLLKNYLIGIGVVLALAIVVTIAAVKIKKPLKGLVRGSAWLACLLIVALIINAILIGPMYSMVSMVFGNGGDISEESISGAQELCETIADEGFVLLKNDGLLPLSGDVKLNTFGWSATNPVYGGTGSGSLSGLYETVSLLKGLENAGIAYNQDLVDFYTNFRASRPGIGMMGQDWTVPEATIDEYESAGIFDNAKAFSDTAMIVLARSGGEGADLPTSLDPNVPDTFNDDGGGTMFSQTGLRFSEYPEDLDASKHYLEPTTRELAMIDRVTKEFKNAIVVINASNAMELGWVNSYPSIKAVILAPGPGQTGFNALGNIITGKTNPSGRTIDTFVADLTAVPAFHNIGEFQYTNLGDVSPMSYGFPVTPNFVNYVEGIYVGYRWYETAAAEGVIDYDKAVVYPFGYGLSYTSFGLSDFSAEDAGESIEVQVTVTNEGNTAGKKTVQVYFQSPYTAYDKENHIEKAAVELCGFGKTQLLEPGASETVTVSVPKRELRTYDAYGAGTYILDEGDYYFTVAMGSHEAVNNILAAKGYTEANGMDAAGEKALTWKWTNEALDDTTYAVSEATGNPITNLFDESDPNRSSLNPGTVTFLSRADWEGTFPTGRTVLTANDELAAALAFTLYQAEEHADTPMPTTASGEKMSVSELIGADYDDPRWESLLDQLTFDEMVNTITLGFHNTAACETVSKAATKDENGPQGLTASLVGGVSGMCYTSEDVMAATMNLDLMEDVGRCIGNDCLDMGYSGLYGPGVNMHRTPYSGRNFEYYSEDPFVAGAICTAETKGIQSKGVYVYLKHVALNDSETSRRGVNTWLTEQAARELYLEVADRAIIDGGAWCVMSGFNRWGTQWSGENYNLQTAYLRGECGMRGMSITDFSGLSAYMDVADGLMGGSDIWDSPMPMIHTVAAATMGGDPHIVSQMRQAMHRILYTVVNSNAMNGWTSETHIASNIPWWQLAIYGLIGAFGVLTLCSLLMMIRSRKNMKLWLAEQQKAQK